MIKRILTSLLVVCTLQACTISYKFNGATLNYDIYKTIYISSFPIRAALVYAPLQQMFELELDNMITRQTRLQVSNNPNSDLTMEGEITRYELTPQAVGDDAYATQTRLTIAIRVKYNNNKMPGSDIDQTFSAYRDFSSSELLTDVQEQLCDEICEEIADLIFNATIGNW
ncbi:MAG: LptE family protein [Bacteroidales bacterium]